MKVLTDEEFSAKLHELRFQVEGLKAEADARGLLQVATDVALAFEALNQAMLDWRREQLQPWEFLKPDGAIGICSWCEQQHKHVPAPGASHGICPRHLAEWQADLLKRKAA